MDRGQKIGIFVSRGTGWPCATAGRLGTEQAIGARTAGKGGQCADVIETGVGADGPARIHGTRSGALGGRKAERGCLRTMPDWAGTMDSTVYTSLL